MAWNYELSPEYLRHAFGKQERGLLRLPTAEFERALTGAIAALPPGQQEAITLRLQGYKEQEIADELGIKLTSAKDRLKRARHNLRLLLLCYLQERRKY